MAVKDFENNGETVDHKDKNAEIEKPPAKAPAETKENSDAIKNAHATGDGSFGRNDSSLPEENDSKAKDEPSY